MLKYRPLNNGADKQAAPRNRNYTNIEKKMFFEHSKYEKVFN